MSRFKRYVPLITSIISIQIVCFFVLFCLRYTSDKGSFLFEQILAVTMAISVTVLLFLLLKRNKLKIRFSLPVLVSLTLISSMLFFILAQFSLLNIDRSRSFYVLSWVENSSVTISLGNIDLSDVRSPEKQNAEAILNRVREQESRGFLSISDSEIALTQKGKFVLRIANVLGKLYRLENWQFNKY